MRLAYVKMCGIDKNTTTHSPDNYNLPPPHKKYENNEQTNKGKDREMKEGK